MDGLPNWTQRTHKRDDVHRSLSLAFKMLGRPARVVACLPGNGARCLAQGVQLGLYLPTETRVFAFERNGTEIPKVRAALDRLGFEHTRLIDKPVETVALTDVEGEVDLVHLDLLGHPTLDLVHWCRERLPRLLSRDGVVIMTVRAEHWTRANPYARLFGSDSELDEVVGKEGYLTKTLDYAAGLLKDEDDAEARPEEQTIRVAAMVLVALNASNAILLPTYADGQTAMATFVVRSENILGLTYSGKELPPDWDKFWPSIKVIADCVSRQENDEREPPVLVHPFLEGTPNLDPFGPTDGSLVDAQDIDLITSCPNAQIEAVLFLARRLLCARGRPEDIVAAAALTALLQREPEIGLRVDKTLWLI